MKPRIAVVIEHGMIVGVHADGPCDVLVVDKDCLVATDKQISTEQYESELHVWDTADRTDTKIVNDWFKRMHSVEQVDE